jgi:zinc/manganese transport system substrate-binding protein
MRYAPATMRIIPLAIVSLLSGAVVAACGVATPSTRPGVVLAVGAESQYANVIAQVGGRYVQARAIESNPNTDPHSFEASPSVAETVAAARLIVQNGGGYDTFMDAIESGSPSRGRTVVVVQRLLGLPGALANPHLWYRPGAAAALARALAIDLGQIEPAHRAYFALRAHRFIASLRPWSAAIQAFASRYRGVPVATTEPVGDYLLTALGADDRTPFPLQADIMNGVDPAPENVAIEDRLFSRHEVRALLYNEQVTDAVTDAFLADARRGGVPVVAVYETMPAGYDYQSWMLAEVRALTLAVAHGRSTTHL